MALYQVWLLLERNYLKAVHGGTPNFISDFTRRQAPCASKDDTLKEKVEKIHSNGTELNHTKGHAKSQRHEKNSSIHLLVVTKLIFFFPTILKLNPREVGKIFPSHRLVSVGH